MQVNRCKCHAEMRRLSDASRDERGQMLACLHTGLDRLKESEQQGLLQPGFKKGAHCTPTPLVNLQLGTSNETSQCIHPKPNARKSRCMLRAIAITPWTTQAKFEGFKTRKRPMCCKPCMIAILQYNMYAKCTALFTHLQALVVLQINSKF